VIYRRGMLELPEPLMPREPVHPVDIVYAYAGADGRQVDASRESGARAIVLAAMGRGNVPPAMFDALARAATTIPVIVTSRALLGRVGPTYGYPGGGRRLLRRERSSRTGAGLARRESIRCWRSASITT
jgi:L-asparaginase/archaeal Glu-tRNAGln amidotransferase subunit D